MQIRLKVTGGISKNDGLERPWRTVYIHGMQYQVHILMKVRRSLSDTI